MWSSHIPSPQLLWQSGSFQPGIRCCFCAALGINKKMHKLTGRWPNTNSIHLAISVWTQCETLKTGSFCRCFSIERAVFGLKTKGEPVVSELRSRSSEIPGASAPGGEQMAKKRRRCFIKMFYRKLRVFKEWQPRFGAPPCNGGLFTCDQSVNCYYYSKLVSSWQVNTWIQRSWSGIEALRLQKARSSNRFL